MPFDYRDPPPPPNDVIRNRGRKHIVSLPYRTLWCGSTETIETEPLKFTFLAKELVVPSWLMGQQIIIAEFKIGGNVLVEANKDVVLEAFHKYRFTPCKVEAGQTIRLILVNHMGMHVSVQLSVKGRILA